MAAPALLLVHKSGKATPTNGGSGQREFLRPSGADGRFGKERERPSAGLTTFRDLGRGHVAREERVALRNPKADLVDVNC